MFKSFFGSTAGAASYIQRNALVDLNSSGIVGSTPVTRWNNSGKGGSDYDLSVVGDTGANLTRATVNGYDAVQFGGSVYLEPASGQSIAGPATVIAVIQFTNAAPGADTIALDSRSLDDPNRWYINTNAASGNELGLYQGGVQLSLPGSYDLNAHVVTAQFNGGATTTLTSSGVGTASGNAGTSSPFDYCTLGARFSGTLSSEFITPRFLIFPFAVRAVELVAIQSYLKAIYATA
jgi:hypothetical protein